VADFTLPELGENISAGDVLRVLVKPGDALAKDQPVLELETDKATIEVPSSVSGTVGEIKVKPGDKVKVGQVILTVADGQAAQAGQAGQAVRSAEASRSSGADTTRPSAPARQSAEAASQQREPSGEHREAAADRPAARAEAAPAAAPPTAMPATPKQPEAAKAESRSPSPPQERDRDKVVDINRGARAAAEAAAPEAPPAPAAPSVRRMARELGVDINEVAGSDPSGRISIDDVKAHAKRLLAAAAKGGPAPAAPLPDFTRWGEVERQPMRAVRRKTAEHLSAAWAAIPHVTQCDLADITGLEELRKKYATQTEAAGGNLTVTAIAVKVIAAALRVFPQFNASIDMAADEIVLKKYVNVGVAVDTDRGLLVPVIRNADRKNIIELAVELAQLSEKARTRKIALEEMQGGTFSISNLGGIGGTYFTPIVNAPEVAILGISRARTEPVWNRDVGQFAPRLMLPLSLSYDHRVIDGADGIRFLRWVCEALEQPFLLSLQG
jgi:pyruvate dehydrogenase E2 component (dihydrolipoyllysine-residue acetyltransferase)